MQLSLLCIQVLFSIFGDGEFFPNSALIKLLGKYVCPADMALEGLCENVLFLICGFDQKEMNMVSMCEDCLSGEP